MIHSEDQIGYWRSVLDHPYAKQMLHPLYFLSSSIENCLLKKRIGIDLFFTQNFLKAPSRHCQSTIETETHSPTKSLEVPGMQMEGLAYFLLWYFIWVLVYLIRGGPSAAEVLQHTIAQRSPISDASASRTC